MQFLKALYLEKTIPYSARPKYGLRVAQLISLGQLFETTAQEVWVREDIDRCFFLNF